MAGGAHDICVGAVPQGNVRLARLAADDHNDRSARARPSQGNTRAGWRNHTVNHVSTPSFAHAPESPDLPAQLEPGDISELVHDAAHVETDLSDVALIDQRANGVMFETVRLGNVDLCGSRLEGLRVADSALKRCNLANIQARRTHATRVTINTSRLTGIHLPEAVLRDVMIQDCRVDLASFGFAHCTRVTFEDCQLTQTDFLEAQLESVRFHRCDLARADFRGARLSRCEFRRSNLTGIQGVESLRGAAMEWPDIVEMAGVWAAALGIEVLDADSCG